MPQTTPPPTPAPAAPQAPAAAPQVVTPMSRTDYRALLEQRERLSDQLQSASSRRASLVRSLQNAPDGVARTGLEARIMVLDKRILQLENELEITGQRIRSEPAAYAAATVAQRGIDRINPNVVAPVAGSFILFVMFPIALAFSRRIWRRGVAPAAAGPRESPESTQRLTRLEEAIDAIAVEVERISEGQRFMTKIMVGQRGTGSPAEVASAPRALGAGEAPAEPIRVAEKEAARMK